MNHEIYAMQVMVVDPFESLGLPRFLALLLTIPLLTFVATLAGLFGGLVVIWTALSLGPTFFLQRIVDNVGAVHFWVGMSKAPVMAMVIAGIGCRQGLEVGGDVDSLGRRSARCGWWIGGGQVRAAQQHHRPANAAGGRGQGVRPGHRACLAPEVDRHRAALGRSVPAGGAVLEPHRARERGGADVRAHPAFAP